MGKLGMHVLDIAQGKPGAGAPMHQLDIAMMFPHFSLFAICANGLICVTGCGNGGWNQIWNRMRTSIRGTASVDRLVRSTDQTARRLQRIVSASAVRRSGVTLSTDLLAPGPEVDRNFRSQFELYFSRDVID